MSTPIQAGVIGLTAISGKVGQLIRVGQYLNGDGFKTFEHAFMSLGNDLIVEAEPGGARVAHADEYSTVYWCNNIARQFTTEQLLGASDKAKAYVGVPYSFLDYDALFCHRLHIPAPGLKAYIGNTGHMICSQLVDQAYADEGLHLFRDSRWPGYVTPGAIYNLDVALGAAAAVR